ncbi:MAG: zinc ribbon domain-containing protein [Clostridia bacterium]|nr:zinc ribbon domain-containing protein [Clostridia bacterium]
MFCSKCGKEIMDEAVVCPYCGCVTTNYQSTQTTPQSASGMYSDQYPALKAFAEEAKSVHTLGILAAIFCLGIGIIFSVMIWVKQGLNPQTKLPKLELTLPNEIAEFELAKKRWLRAGSLAVLPVVVLIVTISLCAFAAL